jgi:transcriptional regulator with XRE-family HTH domain
MPQRAKKRHGNLHFIDVRVGARLRRRREELGMSRKRLAEGSGVGCQQIHKYETAVNRVSPGVLFRFARRLNVPVAYFFDGLPPTTTGDRSTALTEIELHSRETALLIEAFERIPDPKRRRRVSDLIRSFERKPKTER